MKFTQLIKSLEGFHVVTAGTDFEVAGLACDSRKAGADYVFVAIKGADADGHAFVRDAVARGSRAVIAQEETAASSPGLNCIVVRDSRKALAQIAAAFYQDPSQRLRVVGITGTNGKTTVSYLIEAIVRQAGRNPAVIGTVNYRFKDRLIPSLNTTPGPLELQPMLAEMAKAGVEYVAMEVSSHALAQERTEGVHFCAALFTNLTQDHLDYHKTMEDYFQSKARLFSGLNNHAFAVINGDDPYGRRLMVPPGVSMVTYGLATHCDFMASEPEFSLKGSRFTIRTACKSIQVNTPLIGRHNVYNILAAASWALREGFPVDDILAAIAGFRSVPGRLEPIENNAGLAVFVDYAHTEDALKNVIKAIRELSKKRLIVVFGCGGDRDKTKRPKMGAVVAELADFAVVTSDNPRSEDPMAIIGDITRGIRKDNYRVVPDRRLAIKEALGMAAEGDAVLIAGKGHEDYQVLKDGRVHFDDREVARECLGSMNS